MVEYIVVVAALIAALVVGEDVMQAMRDATKGSYEGYSYGVSISELPDENEATPTP